MARTIAGALSGDDQMDGINHNYKEKKMQSVRLNETVAGALSGDDKYVGPSNSLNGIYHQEMTVQFNESTSGKEFAYDDMDLLELTSSQETFILNDIQNLLPVAQPQNLPRAATPTAAPVYYFPNSTVHIHHHN
ncbi:uncharacterized protein LOC134254604 [Saccostrea cucullata]|uniref:uncharacterized protein LOC134254604 n=1 Tax=Saccostrea cuccullata TaxID=36930 RepID=UPI002ED6849F